MNYGESTPMNCVLPSLLAMNTTMGERLDQALQARGLTPPDLIRAIGSSKGAVYNILNDDTKPEKVWASTAKAICSYLRIRMDWLIEGTGTMDAPAAPEPEADWTDIQGYAQAVGLGRGAEAQEYAETHKLKFRADSLARKRLKPSSLAVMYGDGDSMEPRIMPGDAILFDTSDKRVRDGGLYVIQKHGAGNAEIFVKRALVLDDTVYFTSDNLGGDHNWKKPKRMDSEREPIEVIGRVRWIGSWEH